MENHCAETEAVIGPRFRVRLEEMLDDAESPPGLLRGVLPRLETFLRPLVTALRPPAQRTNAHRYVHGLLSDLPSKDVESIASSRDCERQGLPKFIGPADWEHQPLLTERARPIGTTRGQADGVLVFDPSACAKKGNDSVGVQRPWCGRLGKVENGQVGVYLACVSGLGHALVAVRLDLPTDWTSDRKRLRKAGAPRDVHFATRHGLALEMLDHRGPLLPRGWAAGDDEMGRSSWSRQELGDRGEHYPLAVPSHTRARDLRATEPPHSGRGRRPRQPLQRAERWRAALPESAWQTVGVRDAERGPLVTEGARTRGQARTGGKVSAATELLVVFRARQSDGTWKHDYLLGNVLADVWPLGELARVYQAEHRVEECLQRAKSEAGLGDYQVRTWNGWHHHQALSRVATWFLAEGARRGKNTDTRSDGAAVARAECRAAEPAVTGGPPGAVAAQREPAFASQRASTLLRLDTTQRLATTTL